MQTTAPHSKVVVESSASNALLALAFHEGLLTESEDNDNCLKSLARRQYPKWLTTQALEQVVLFDQLHLTAGLPWRGLQGELVENGPFFQVDKSPNPDGSIQKIDPAILNGILKARGISPTPFEAPEILVGVKEALHKLEEWKKKYNEEPPSPMSIFLDKFFKRLQAVEPRYAELEKIRQPLNDFQPIAKAVEDYLAVVATARDRVAFAMAPVFQAPSQELFQPELGNSEANPPTVLLRITSAQLGALPYGQSLKKTLRLARDPATSALRFQIQEWTKSLTEDSASDTERIQKEISNALSFLRKASIGSRVSNITTYLGLPIAMLTPVSTFVGAIGWGCTVAGFIGLAAADAASRKYQWASFGSSN